MNVEAKRSVDGLFGVAGKRVIKDIVNKYSSPTEESEKRTQRGDVVGSQRS